MMDSAHTQVSAPPLRSLRRGIGRPLQSLAHATGVMHLSAGARRRCGAVILMYHTVASEEVRPFIDPRNHVPVEVFAEQMRFLAEHRRVVALSELIETIERGAAPAAGTVAITFDDGYLDNLTVAAPILASLDLPATLFLPTAIIDRQEPQWIDQVWMAFRNLQARTLQWPAADGASHVFDLTEHAARDAAHRAVCASMLEAAPATRRELLDDLHRQLPAPVARPLTMSWDDVHALRSQFPAFEIGGHTVEHTALTCVSEAEAMTELTGCREAMHARTGRTPQHFSFPYGRTSPALRGAVREAGFRSACGGGGGGGGPVIRENVDPFALPRVEAPPSMKRFALLTDSVNTGFWRRLGR